MIYLCNGINIFHQKSQIMTKNKLVTTNFDGEYYPLLVAFAKSKGLTLSSALRLIVIERFDNDDPQKQKDALKEFFQSKI